MGDDETVYRTDLRLEGAWFTHQLTGEEIAADQTRLGPDFAVVDFGLDPSDNLRLADGSGELKPRFGPLEHPILGVLHKDELDETEPVIDPDGVLHGPAGWLSRFGAGDLVALQRQGDTVAVERVGAVESGEREIAVLQRGYALAARGRVVGIEPTEFMLEAIGLDPEVWSRPVRPLVELLAEAGFEQRGPGFGPAGEEWEGTYESGSDPRKETIDEFDFNPCCTAAFDAAALAVARQIGPDASTASLDGIDWEELEESLLHGQVTRALCHYTTLDKLGDSVLALAEVLAGRSGGLRVAGMFLTALVTGRDRSRCRSRGNDRAGGPNGS